MNPTSRTGSPSHEVWQRTFVQSHRTWCDDLVVELRLLDVPGPVIGDRLAEVETHCGATGETPTEAFGDPVAYATRIAQDSAEEPASGVWTIAALGAGQVLAMLVGTTAVTDWARGEELTYNVVQVVLLGLFVLVLLGLPVILRPLVRHPWAVGVPLFVGLPLLTVAAALSTRFDLPVVLLIPSAPVAVGLFVVVVVLARLEHRELARDLHDDLVTSPLSPQGDAPAVGRHPHRWTTLVLTGMIPLAYIALAVLGWVFA